jgi:Mn2+/Fe2+ NRAMP family transporter
VINGVLAPPLIVSVVLLASDRSVMGEHANSPLLRLPGWTTAILMAAASVAMFIT